NYRASASLAALEVGRWSACPTICFRRELTPRLRISRKIDNPRVDRTVPCSMLGLGGEAALIWHRPRSGRSTSKACRLHRAAARERGLHHHQFAHVLRREQTDQAFHAVEHGHCRAMALLHDAERFFKACAGGDGGNIAPHPITHPNPRIIFAQSRK